MSKYHSKTTAGFVEIPQSDPEADPEAFVPAKRHSRQSWICRLWPLLCLIAGLTVGGHLGSYVPWVRNLDQRCMSYISEDSPVIQEVDIEFDVVHFNGSLFKRNLFRQDAGSEVDEAWESLGVDYRAAIVPIELAEISGLTPYHVQVRPEYGGGFPANVEGLHHLHCLNLLRQSLYYNFEHYHQQGKGAFKNEDSVLKDHVTHCLDTLRQQLMCTVDVGMLGQVWWNKNSPQAYPDFNTQHKCRNFDDIRRWAEKHQAPDEVPPDYLLPPTSEEAVYPEIP
ncbi:hypothetical protein MMC10_008906 [Thelotrema lepadinum]|nr:hypothetical protein [Thelotrema lepadinum]